ncbi:MAG: hypothetical protein EOO73_02290 [Myxococcales bacterium]|nr:MAG: hypothetical protein EOO73_02290 [Myxococcales bacterium]
MRRLASSRVVWINALGVVAALVLALFGGALRSRPAITEAWAQPPAPAALAVSEAPAQSAPPAPSAALAPSGAPAPEPIDLAIAPNGGVPHHPSGTLYRSPFAKPNADKPARVKVGMLLNSVDDYNVQTGTFLADFFLSFTSDTPMPEIRPQFPNGKVDATTVIADKPTFKLLRLSGQFKSPADLRKYPYDSQELKILIEDDTRGVDQVRFVVDRERTKTARGFRAVGWQVAFVEARSLSQSYPDRFEGDDLFYGRYVFTVGLNRFAASAVFKVYVPALVIVLISLLGMWVPPDHMEVRSNAGAPMLAGAVLFHFSLMQELPATSYLTRADKLMLGVYASLLLGMLSTWAMFLVDEDKMTRVFRIARTVVPIATVVVMALAMTL